MKIHRHISVSIEYYINLDTRCFPRGLARVVQIAAKEKVDSVPLIKLIRQETGLGLKESKEMFDAIAACEFNLLTGE